MLKGVKTTQPEGSNLETCWTTTSKIPSPLAKTARSCNSVTFAGWQFPQPWGKIANSLIAQDGETWLCLTIYTKPSLPEWLGLGVRFLKRNKLLS